MFKQGLLLSPNCNLISDSVVFFFFHFIMDSNAVVHVKLFFLVGQRQIFAGYG